MSSSENPQEGLNVLCIDGGGARGLSALILLDELMKRLQPLKQVDPPPSPYECFDIIAGTGTGAVQACMLGRLRMPVRSAIESYASLASNVFSEKKWFGTGSFKTTKLKDSLRDIIRNATGDPDEPMINRQQTEEKCKTLVFAMSTHNMRASIPTVFRSYPVAANEGPQCTIWETLCATMAHPDLFKPFDIGSPPLNQSFVDAGLGCSNPLSHVLAEVKILYPERHVASVTSIGTGHTRTIQIPNTTVLRHLLPITAIVAMKGIATDTERVAEEMARRFNSTKDVYYRLSVDQGMQSVGMDGWEQLSEVLGHTHAYIGLGNVNQRMDEMAQTIHSRRSTIPTEQIDGEIQVATAIATTPSVVQRCPAPTPTFTGCESTIRRIELCITGGFMERRVCIVHGLGGTGKTQTALKAIERTYNRWKEIIYVDATTQESIEGALKDFAIYRKSGSTYQDALQWLGTYREQWLLVFDNADDHSLPLRNYLPGGNHGSILITTRLFGMVSLAQGPESDCSISSMDPDDALVLLLKLARKQDQDLAPREAESAEALLQDFGYFALAIVHAGSFIGQSPHMSITEYRSLFAKQQRRALEAYSRLPAAVKAESDKHTVYTAWLMCYEKLSPRAQELLWLIGFLHHTRITVEIFQRAAVNLVSYNPALPASPQEGLVRRKLCDFLQSFLDADQQWDGLLFTETIGEIISRSILEYDGVNHSYRIHVLVQSWVRTIVPWAPNLAEEYPMALLAICTPFDNSLESIQFRISIGLHVDKTLPGNPDKISANYALCFARIYDERGQWNRVQQLETQVQEKSRQILGNEHPDTLSATHRLAWAYSRLNRLEEAKDLQVQVLNARKQVLGDDHPDTLLTMHSLAVTYANLNQLDEARHLEVQVLDVRKRVLGDEHPDTLRTMNNLAVTYANLNQLDEARHLQVQVLNARKRVLGDEHPDTLRTMYNLALTYYQLNRLDEARDLQIQVLDAQKRVLGHEHPETLSTMHSLALTYYQLNRLDEAEHPDTLRTMNSLANTYSRFNRLDEARHLQIQVLDARKRVLGHEHPETLSTMHNLALTYYQLNRLDEARDLEVQVLDARKRVLGDEHPDTLETMHNLAVTYSDLNRLDEARHLQVQVLDARKRVLGDEHPDTLSTMNNLALTYYQLNRLDEPRDLGEDRLRTRTVRDLMQKIQDTLKEHWPK